MDRKIFIPRVPARSPALARTVFKPNFDTVLLSPGTKLIVFQNGWAGDSTPETSSKRKFLAVALQILFFLLGRESFYCWAAKDFQLLGCKSFLFLMRCKCFFYCWVAKVFQLLGCKSFQFLICCNSFFYAWLRKIFKYRAARFFELLGCKSFRLLGCD